MISDKHFIGVVNVGVSRRSNFEVYKEFKKNIKPCKRKNIIKYLNFKLAKDASMSLKLFKKIKKEKW